MLKDLLSSYSWEAKYDLMFPLSFCVAFQVYNQKNPIVSGVSVSFFDFGFIKKRREKKEKVKKQEKVSFE